jgi:hypothetical protein
MATAMNHSADRTGAIAPKAAQPNASAVSAAMAKMAMTGR